MSGLGLWKVIIDICLMAGVVYLVHRLSRVATQANVKPILELESGLRALIQEAETSGRGLNDQLLKRQQALEKVLFDVESAEHRINRAITAAEERRGELEGRVERTRYNRTEQARKAPRAPGLERSNPSSEMDIETFEPEQDIPMSVEEPTVQRVDPIMPPPPEPPSFESIVQRPVSRRATRANPYAQPRAQRSNADFDLPPAGPPQRGLNLSIEREILDEEHARSIAEAPMSLRERVSVADDSASGTRPSNAEPLTAEQAELQRVYDRAEALLKAGQGIQDVSNETQLPVEDVTMLREMVQRERQEQMADAATHKDPRLGVLGGVKRTVATL